MRRAALPVRLQDAVQRAAVLRPYRVVRDYFGLYHVEWQHQHPAQHA